MRHALEADIALWIVENLADGILPVGSLGAIKRPTRQQGRQLRDGKAIELVCEDMVQPCLAVWDLLLQSFVETLGDLAQEYAGFAARIEETGILCRSTGLQGAGREFGSLVAAA